MNLHMSNVFHAIASNDKNIYSCFVGKFLLTELCSKELLPETNSLKLNYKVFKKSY